MKLSPAGQYHQQENKKSKTILIKQKLLSLNQKYPGMTQSLTTGCNHDLIVYNKYTQYRSAK